MKSKITKVRETKLKWADLTGMTARPNRRLVLNKTFTAFYSTSEVTLDNALLGSFSNSASVALKCCDALMTLRCRCS